MGARYAGGMDVAPWVAPPDRPDIAEALLLHLLAAFPDRQVAVAVPEENKAALGLLEDLGFEPASRPSAWPTARGPEGSTHEASSAWGAWRRVDVHRKLDPRSNQLPEDER